MKRKLSFSSIFAIATVATTTLLITGCEQDEEYYSQSDETLAERMMTRAAEGGGVTPPLSSDTNYVAILQFSEEFTHTFCFNDAYSANIRKTVTFTATVIKYKLKKPPFNSYFVGSISYDESQPIRLSPFAPTATSLGITATIDNPYGGIGREETLTSFCTVTAHN